MTEDRRFCIGRRIRIRISFLSCGRYPVSFVCAPVQNILFGLYGICKCALGRFKRVFLVLKLFFKSREIRISRINLLSDSPTDVEKSGDKQNARQTKNDCVNIKFRFNKNPLSLCYMSVSNRVIIIIIGRKIKSKNEKTLNKNKNHVKSLDSSIYTGYNEQACNRNAVFCAHNLTIATAKPHERSWRK